MSTERFNLAAGIKPMHVAFKGQPEMIVEIVTGRVHFGIPSLGTAMPFIKDGRLLPLAVNTPKRSPHLPDVPAMLEILPELRAGRGARAHGAGEDADAGSCRRSARTSRACSRCPT